MHLVYRKDRGKRFTYSNLKKKTSTTGAVKMFITFISMAALLSLSNLSLQHGHIAMRPKQAYY